MQPDFRGIAIIFNARVIQGENGLGLSYSDAPDFCPINGITEITTKRDMDLGRPMLPFLSANKIAASGGAVYPVSLTLFAGSYSSYDIARLAYSPKGLCLISMDNKWEWPEEMQKFDAILGEYRKGISEIVVKPMVPIPGFFGA